MTDESMASIANHLWQSTLFVAGIGLLAFLLKNNRAAVRHRLWLAASLKFLLPFSFLTAIGSQIHWRTPVTVAPAPVTFVFEKVGQPFTAAMNIPSEAVPAQSNAISMILLIVWTAGVLVGACLWFIRWWRVRRALRLSTPVAMDLPIPVVAYPERIAPGVFGLFRPVLLLPSGVSGQLSREQMDAVVAHEMCHVRRRDNLTSALHMVVETLFWFHPFLWWVKTRLADEQEKACDEEVLRQGLDPWIYAQSILKICELCLASPSMCVSGITGAGLKKRIDQIMSNRAVPELSAVRKALLLLVAVLLVCVPLLLGSIQFQTPASSPTPPGELRFEVASIKPYADSAGPVFYGFRWVPGSPRMTFSGVTVKMLLEYSYRIRDFQIIGGPDWINSERYDIQAKAEDGSVTRKDFSDPMVFPEPFAVRMQSLLDERFHLKMHRETRDLPVYELLAISGGAKAILSADQSPQEPVTFGDSLPGPPDSVPIRRVGVAIRRTVGGFMLEGRSVTVASFVDVLSQHVGRPIVNKANLRPGLYDIRLQWSGTPSAGGTPENADAPSIFTALREQLGLRLATGKGPVEVFVIESVEKPTPN